MNRLLDTIPRSALDECGHIDGVRVWARLVGGALLVIAASSFILPWTQTATGDGRVIAYAPDDRETPVRAPVDGRIVRWLVNEGDAVKAGQLLAEMGDNDAEIVDRLQRARDAVLAQRSAMTSAVAVARSQVAALSDARDAAIEAAKLKVSIAMDEEDGARQRVLALRAKKKTTELNLARQRRLNQQDLASDRQRELAELAAATAATELDQANARLRAAKRKVRAAQAGLKETQTKQRAVVAKARAELAKLRADASKLLASTAAAETRLSRQQRMTIVAPRAGKILAIQARQGSDYVKAGQPLAILVPDTEKRAVELWVDGNDAPLISEGRKVRLQFEGWPAVQFVGWPSVAVGTFGGRVAFVDAAARRHGRFRVVVVPDETEGRWPSVRYLRQGTRARGWVLLNRVSVAYEIWRQLNGFPPGTRPPERAAGPTTERGTK